MTSLTTTTPPVAALAALVGGHRIGDLILTDHGHIYPGIAGTVRLQRRGEPVVTLGAVGDDPEVLAAAFREAVQ